MSVLGDDNPAIVFPSILAQFLGEIIHSLGAVGRSEATRGEIDLRVDDNQQTVRQLDFLDLCLVDSVFNFFFFFLFIVVAAGREGKGGEEHDGSDEMLFHCLVFMIWKFAAKVVIFYDLKSFLIHSVCPMRLKALFTHSRFSGLYQKKKRCWASFSSLVLAQKTGSKV